MVTRKISGDVEIVADTIEVDYITARVETDLAYDNALSGLSANKIKEAIDEIFAEQDNLPTGTIASPPTVDVGKAWLDTTDSSTHPIKRVRLT